MKKKSLIIQQGVVTELMSQLANLPEREKAPDDPVSLSEIFRAKEYMTEIRGALKRGYSFDDLAEIFTERCGVAVSARQIKYHFTRGKNRGTKNKSGRKAGESATPKDDVSFADSPKKDNAEGMKEIVVMTDSKTDSEAKYLSKGTGKETGFVSDNGAIRGAQFEAFSLDKQRRGD